MQSEIRKVSKADRLTLEYYFQDTDWFDNTDWKEERRSKSFNRTTHNNKHGIQPQRCIKCRRPFQRLAVVRNYGNYVYLNRGVFEGVILEKGVCHGCK